MSKKLFAKMVLVACVVVIGSASFGGPVFAAVKIGGKLAHLAGPAAESSVLALLGAGFLMFASAIRRLRVSAE